MYKGSGIYQFPVEELSDEDLQPEFDAWISLAESLQKQTDDLLEKVAEYIDCAENVYNEMERRKKK